MPVENWGKINQVEDLPYWIGFNFFEGIGPLRFKLLLDYFGSAKKAWLASINQWRALGLGEKTTEKFFRFKTFFPIEEIKIENNFLLNLPNFLGNFEEFLADEERKKQFWWVKRTKAFQKTDGQQIMVLSWLDEFYPERLKTIGASPPVIYLKLKTKNTSQNPEKIWKVLAEFWQKPAIGVVGTRKVSSYGRLVTEKLVSQLVEQGLVIVSGMARGVDGLAHRVTLANKGQTAAVLGSGADVVYPQENRDIYEKLGEITDDDFCGLIISEFPPGFPPLPGNFPSRNRIIAGLSDAILVTEASEDSGSLITARLAAEQGKDVFAVPGPITSSLSAGTAFLIKQGAKLITGIDDVLEEIGLEKLQAQKLKVKVEELTEEERKIWQSLDSGEKYLDEIVRETGLEAAAVGSILSIMVIKGLIKDLGGGRWAK
jgi:DNA processing protein